MEKIATSIIMFKESYIRLKEIADTRGMNMAGVILFLLALYEKEEAKIENKN